MLHSLTSTCVWTPRVEGRPQLVTPAVFLNWSPKRAGSHFCSIFDRRRPVVLVSRHTMSAAMATEVVVPVIVDWTSASASRFLSTMSQLSQHAMRHFRRAAFRGGAPISYLSPSLVRLHSDTRPWQHKNARLS